MSKSGPSTYVVVGDTDQWSLVNRGSDVAVDSRLRGVRQDATANECIVTAGSRSIADNESWFFQYLPIAQANAARVGIASSIARNFSTTSCGGAAGVTGDTAYVTRTGTIHTTGVADQTGLLALSGEQRLGVHVYGVGGALRVQFYRDSMATGAVVTPTGTSTNFWPCASLQTAANEGFLYLDRDDLTFIPAGAQAYGAAARVSDAGGVSPAASKFTVTDADYTIDSYGKTATGTTDSNGITEAGNAPALRFSKGVFYVEFGLELDSGTIGYVGIGARGSAVGGTRYPGWDATSWGWNAQAAQKVYNGVAAALGSILLVGERACVFWNPITGNIWFGRSGVAFSGSPSAGTGAHYTGVTGDLVPLVRPSQSRMRLYSHEREQLYRPSYATAWDGTGLLPEQHFAGHLQPGTEISRAIGYSGFLEGGRSSGAPVGVVEIANADGNYDALVDYNLRDQDLTIYEVTPDGLQYLARELVDHALARDESTLTIFPRGRDVFLDVPVPYETFTLGKVAYQPAELREVSSSTFKVSDTPYCEFSVIDQGVTVTSWRRATTSTAEAGFKRTVALAGKNAATSIRTFRYIADVAMTNAALTWNAGVLTGWTITQTAPNATVTQVGALTRMLRNAGAPTCRISQTMNPSSGITLFVRFNVNSWTAGGLTISHTNGSSVSLTLGEFGTFWASIIVSGAGTFQIDANDTSDFQISSLAFHQVDSTEDGFNGPAYLIQNLAGLTSADWTYPATSLSSTYGYFSKSRPKLRQVMDAIMPSIVADYYTSARGVLTFVQLPTFPLAAPLRTLTEGQSRGDLVVEDVLAPNLSSLAQSSYNYDVHTTSEVAGSVTDNERRRLTHEYAEEPMDQITSFLHPFYDHAQAATPMPRLTYLASGADFPLNTLLTLFTTRVKLYRRSFDVEAVRGLSPNDQVTLKADRFGLSAGKKAIVISIRRRTGDPTADLVLLGQQ